MSWPWVETETERAQGDRTYEYGRGTRKWYSQYMYQLSSSTSNCNPSLLPSICVSSLQAIFKPECNPFRGALLGPYHGSLLLNQSLPCAQFDQPVPCGSNNTSLQCVCRLGQVSRREEGVYFQAATCQQLGYTRPGSVLRQPSLHRCSGLAGLGARVTSWGETHKWWCDTVQMYCLVTT